jgi:hypothetical protein
MPALGRRSATASSFLFVSENGGKLADREVEYFFVDDESDPAKATENTNKLVRRDQVDVLVGSVHSGVAMAMAKVARETKTLLIVPNAGADELTGALCAPNIFRTSFTNWQPAYAMGKDAAEIIDRFRPPHWREFRSELFVRPVTERRGLARLATAQILRFLL